MVSDVTVNSTKNLRHGTIRSYVNKNDPYPNLPKIPFNVAATIVVTGLIIQTYCFYYTEPVGWWPLWPF